MHLTLVLMDNTAQYTRLKHNSLPSNSGINYFIFCIKINVNEPLHFGLLPTQSSREYETSMRGRNDMRLSKG